MDELSEHYFKISIDENPYFHTVSQEIHLPFSYTDFTESLEHQASLIHEYTHLVQALSTVQGIYGFIGISERLIHFFDAIHNKNELKYPIFNWARNSSDQSLVAYHKYELHYKEQRNAGNGYWKLSVSEPSNNLEIKMLEQKIGTKILKRWHIVRTFGSEVLAIPILVQALCEAQAESVATYYKGKPSPIFETTGKESAKDLLFYTSIPAIIQKMLPLFPQMETTYLLTDYALMTFAPDEAFVRGIDFLKTQDTPRTLREWQKLRDKLEAHIGFELISLPNIRKEIELKIRVYEKHEGNQIIKLFLQRLKVGQKMLLLKEKNSFQFFPWERTVEGITKNMLNHIPVPFTKFIDGHYAFGNPSDDDHTKQAILSAASFLFDVLSGKKNPECPLRGNLVHCPVERTLECSHYPWGRGDVGGKLCPHGMLGTILKINNASLSEYSEDSIE